MFVFVFLTNQHLEPEIWEVLTVCSKILENVVLSKSWSLYSNRFTHQRLSIHPARNHMWDHTEQNADVRCRDILCPKQKFELGELKTYWVDCVGYRRVFCKELKIQKKKRKNTTQKYKIKSELQGNRLASHLFCKLVLAFQNEHGVGSLAHFEIRIFFCILYFWNFGFVFFCILYFWNFGSVFFCILYFWIFWYVFFFVFCIFEKLHSY